MSSVSTPTCSQHTTDPQQNPFHLHQPVQHAGLLLSSGSSSANSTSGGSSIAGCKRTKGAGGAQVHAGSTCTVCRCVIKGFTATSKSKVAYSTSESGMNFMETHGHAEGIFRCVWVSLTNNVGLLLRHGSGSGDAELSASNCLQKTPCTRSVMALNLSKRLDNQKSNKLDKIVNTHLQGASRDGLRMSTCKLFVISTVCTHTD